MIPVTTLFDSYVAVDWSASNKPTSGKDSIWSCVADERAKPLRTTNHRTRRAAEAWLLHYLTVAVHAGRRVLVGLDFPYGYPAGFAAALELQGEPWRAVWIYLEGQIVDDGHNVSNRFEVAARINQQLGRHAPFWGRPDNLMLPSLPFRKEVLYRTAELGGLSEWRQAEQELQRLKTRPQSVWKLAGAGAVGSQSLVGIPIVARLRDHEALRDVSRVWPFEVHVPDRRAGSPAVVHAEIWPTIVPFNSEPGAYRDEKQVRAVVRHWRELDRVGHLGNLFAAAPDNEAVQHEEGWVLGAPAPGTPNFAPPRPPRRAAPALERGKPSATVVGTPTSSPRQPCLCGCGNFQGFPLRGTRHVGSEHGLD